MRLAFFVSSHSLQAQLEEYFLPGIQLNPAVKNFRLLTHNWGSDGMDVVMVAEYDNWADIEASAANRATTTTRSTRRRKRGTMGIRSTRRL